MGYTSKYKGAEIDALLDKVNQGGNGGGVPIVSSETELNANAPAGSLSVVAFQGGAQELRFRDLYQPDASIMGSDGSIANPEILSSVSSLKWKKPNEITGNASVYLIPLPFTNTEFIILQARPSAASVMIVSGSGNQSKIILSIDNGETTIDDAALSEVNNILSNGNWVYLGNPQTFNVSEAEFATLDSCVTVVSGAPSEAELYIKKDTWGIPNIERFNALNKTIGNKENKKQVVDASYNLTPTLGPNEIGVFKSYNRHALEITLLSPTERVSEYIAYIDEATGVTLKVEDPDTQTVKWINGEIPVLDVENQYELNIVAVVTKKGNVEYKAICAEFK